VSGIRTFKRGHIWRVGNGRSINIWKDHWIPGNLSRKIDTVRGHNLLRTVEELINPTTGQWDEELIRDTFHPLEVQKILEIPISPNLEEDFVAWHKTRTYIFSVRSAYYTEWEHQFRIKIGRSDGQGSSMNNPVWDILWQLRVPAKIKIFGWRALHGLIPGLGVLANRHIKVSAQCPICWQGSEDIRHLMFTCGRAKEVWKSLGLEEVINNAVNLDRSGSVVLEEILRSPIKKSPVLGQLGLQEIVLVASWYIWWQRREAVKGERVAPPLRSAFSIQALALNYGLAAKRATPKQVQWIKPSWNNYKANIDASYFPNGRGAVAVVIRNDHGEVIAGGAWPKQNLLDAMTAEAEALRHGLHLIESIGCAPVTIETDCLELVQACNGAELWSPCTPIIADCCEIAQRLGMITFQHCQREANKVAHNLARSCFQEDIMITWDDDPPRQVALDALDDLAVLNNVVIES
jgi:ribonuclease HI